MTGSDLEREVARLLKRSDEEDQRATAAADAGFKPQAVKHRQNAENLYEQAATLDPEFTASAWKQ